MPTYVAGVDSSTQSCKVVIVEAETGRVVREGRTKHPAGSEVDPASWWKALEKAIAAAGGLSDVSSISIGGQQHGMVVLDSRGDVIRDALLWNDTRSADEAKELLERFGADWLLEHTGSVPVASFTSTKLRWLAKNEPRNASQIAAVMLPHDWLSWRLAGYGGKRSKLGPDFGRAWTDRSDASGTGYFDPAKNEYVPEVLEYCLGAEVAARVTLPKVLGAAQTGGKVFRSDIAIGGGAGDNAAAAKGLGLELGEAAVSIGTSGTVFAISEAVGTGAEEIAGFADVDGRFLPLACTLNAAQVLDMMAAQLDVTFDEFERLALSAPAGAEGLILLPFFAGERTPNLPNAKASWHGVTLANFTPENIARASIEGILLSLANALELFRTTGRPIRRVHLIGGAAANHAVQQIAAGLFGGEVEVPSPGEYVALGAARQAAEMLGISTQNWVVDSTVVKANAYPIEILNRFMTLVNAEVGASR
jgi:xylulokinase